MKLNAWLRRNKVSQGRLSRCARVPLSVINRLVRGESDTSGKYWARITLATGGAVRPEDHYPPPAGIRSAA